MNTNESSTSLRPLAYVFWHWPRPEIPADAYEKELADFLRSILASKPRGLTDAMSFRIEEGPWGSEGRMIYEDWYLMNDFGDLGSINDAAVKGEAGGAHNSIKKDLLKGAGGIFRSIQGDLETRKARYAIWVEKPTRDLSYPSYYEKMAEITRHVESNLWRRQMQLGPAPQFCLHVEDAITLPNELSPKIMKLAPIET